MPTAMATAKRSAKAMPPKMMCAGMFTLL
jgi:hypothetical protein